MADSPTNAAPLAAWLTAQGPSAIAVLAVVGGGAVAAVDRAFRPLRKCELAATPIGRPRLGRIGTGIGDEVLVVRISETPQEVEIHCHGGPAARRLVEEALVAAGARRAGVEDLERLRGRRGTTLDARLQLPNARTRRAAAILLEQADGSLDRAIEAVIRDLTPRPAEAVAQLRTLLDRGRWGVKLLEPTRVVIRGRPNVGKSALMNAIAGFDRAIVDSAAGTTRDVVILETAIDGWPVEICDTAGLRETDDPIELAGIQAARSAAESADIAIWVFDRSRPLDAAAQALALHDPQAIQVANKSDLPAAWDADALGMLAVSALTGERIASLIAGIAARIAPETPPTSGSAVPFLAKHMNILEQALRRLAAGDAAGSRIALESLL